MKKWILALGAVALLAVPLAFAVRTAIGSRTSQPGPEIARVTRRDMTSVVKATGVVRPIDGAEVRVGTRASGRLDRLHVRLGDRVERGQVLVELETRELLARRAQAVAVLASSRANLAFSALDRRRKRELVAKEVLAPSELDAAERGASVAEAAVDEAKASIALIDVELANTKIVAPISSIVASVALQEGEMVAATPAAPTLLTLIDPLRLELRAYVDETDIGQVKVGQPARFSVDAYPGREVDGHVTGIHPKPEIRDNVVNYVVVIAFAPPSNIVLRPEMTANVKVVLEARENALVVPRRAVRRDQGRSYVIARKDGASARRWVTTGSRDETGWEIVDGLRDGDDVLLGDAPLSTPLRPSTESRSP